MRARLVAIGLVTIGGLGCRTPRPPPPPKSPGVEAYAPLAVGHRWTYAVRFPGQSGERTVRIVARDEVGYYIDDAGGALRITAEGLRDRRRYLIRTPLEPGAAWRAVVSANAVESYRVVSVGEPCETRAGRFEDCLVVQSSLRRDDEVTLEVSFTWVREVGLAKVETVAEIAGKGRVPQTEQNLLRYRLGSGAPPAEGGGKDEAPDTWAR